MASNHSTSPQDDHLPHYLQDEDPFASKLSREADLVAGFYLTVIGVLSTFGNGYVLFMSLKRKKKLRPAEIMTVNLAVCDLGISVVGKPFSIISFFSHRWVFGWLGCRWYGWAGFFFGCGSLITMTAVSLDRYLKICHLTYGTWLKRHHAFICLAIIWAYAMFWATVPFAGLGNYAPEPFGTSCTLDWWLAQASVAGQAFILNILFFCLLLPTAVIVFSYVKIIAKVKSSAKEVAHYDTRIQNNHVLEIKLTKVALQICGYPLYICQYPWIIFADHGFDVDTNFVSAQGSTHVQLITHHDPHIFFRVTVSQDRVPYPTRICVAYIFVPTCIHLHLAVLKHILFACVQFTKRSRLLSVSELSSSLFTTAPIFVSSETLSMMILYFLLGC
uniref:Opsin-5 n=1 Tax=Gopherus agassizii TaxID=38772 RepID=A0A452HY96_9SAUR